MTAADRFRAAREAFELATRLNCTPRDAARELRRRRAACGRIAAPAPSETHDEDADQVPAPTAHFSAWNNPWMMRE